MKKDTGASSTPQPASQQQSSATNAAVSSQKLGTSTSTANITSPNLPGFLQIKNLVSQLNSKKMLRQQRTDILNIVQQLGIEGSQYLLDCLFDSIDLNGISQQAKSSLHTTIKGQFLSQHLHELIFSTTAATNFIDFFPQVLLRTITTSNGKIPSIHTFFGDFCKFLKIPILDQIFLALALALAHHNEILSVEGLKMLKERINEYHSQATPHAMPQNSLPTLLLQFVSHNPDFKNMQSEITMLKQQIYQIDTKNKPLLLGKGTTTDDDGHGLVGSDELHDSELHREAVFTKLDEITSLLSPADILNDLGPTVSASLDGMTSDLHIFSKKWTSEDIFRCLEVICKQQSERIRSGTTTTTTIAAATSSASNGNEEILGHQRLAHIFYQAQHKNNQQDWNNFTNQEQKPVTSLNGQSNLIPVATAGTTTTTATTATPTTPSNNPSNLSLWNFDIVLEFFLKNVITPSKPQIQWADVLLSLDRDESTVMNDESALRMLLEFLIEVNRQSSFIFPCDLILKKWKHPRRQIAFMKSLLLLENPLHLIRWEELTKTPVNLDFNPSYKFEKLTSPVTTIQFFACVEFLQLLVELSDGDDYLTVLHIFEPAIKYFPDILAVALAQLHPQSGANLLDELFTALIPNFLVNHVAWIPVLDAIWRFNNGLLVSVICEMYRREKQIAASSQMNTTTTSQQQQQQQSQSTTTALQHLTRVIDISQYIKDSLLVLAHCHDYSFAVALAILAGKREYLNFDSWLNDRIVSIGDPFVNALLAYIDENIILPLRAVNSNGSNNAQKQQGNVAAQLQARLASYETILEKAQVTMEILTIIFESLLVDSSPEKLTNKNRAKLQEQYREIISMFPSTITAHAHSIASSNMSNSQSGTTSNNNNTSNPTTNGTSTNNNNDTATTASSGNSNSTNGQQQQSQGASNLPNLASERKANTYFERFYAKSITLEEITTLLKTLNSSNNTDDREVFACMISSLLEETKYHEQYPLAELLLTGALFGAIILNGMISSKPLGIMMEAILDSTRRSQKRVDFAAKAIEAMRPRLIDFPNFVNAVFEPTCMLTESHPALLISIHNLMNEKKVHISTTQKQIEQLKQRIENLKHEQNQRNKALTAQQQQQSQSKSLQQSNAAVAATPTAAVTTTASNAAKPQQQQAKQQQPTQSQQQASSSASVATPTQQNPISSNSSTPSTTNTSVAATAPNSESNKEDKSKAAVSTTPTASPAVPAATNGTTTSANTTQTATSIQNDDKQSQLDANNASKKGKKGLKTTKQVFVIDGQSSQATGTTTTNPSSSTNSTLITPTNQNNNRSFSLQQSLSQPLPQSNSQQQQSQQTTSTNITNLLASPSPMEALARQLSLPMQSQIPSINQNSTFAQQNIIGEGMNGISEDDEPRARPYTGGVGFNLLTPLTFDPQTYAKLTLAQILVFEDTLPIEDQIKNKVNFGQNNFSEQNLEKHSNDIKNYCENEQFIAWFARYLSMRRATLETESTIHLYMLLLERVNKPTLAPAIIKESLLLLSKFLHSEMAVSASDRTTLKNLAFWIGMFTLARNRSISSKYFNMKAAIVSAQQTNRLDIVVPIIAQILKATKDSKVFNPQSNRWVRRILGLLFELRSMTTKETIKLHINAIFSNLNVDPSSLEPCTYLQYFIAEQNRVKSSQQNQQVQPLQQQQQQEQQLQQQSQSQSQQVFFYQKSTGIMNFPDMLSAPGGGQVGQVTDSEWMQGLAVFAKICEDQVYLGDELNSVEIPSEIHLKKIITESLNTAIMSIIHPVISRCVTIALLTTKEIILKDFCMEPDEKVLLKGAKAMAQRLASPLTIASCKEALNKNFLSELSALLETTSPNLPAQTKSAILACAISNNLDTGCDTIKTCVIQQVLIEINNDETILQAIEARKAAKKANVLFKDDKYFPYLLDLPEILQPKSLQAIVNQTQASTAPAALQQ